MYKVYTVSASVVDDGYRFEPASGGKSRLVNEYNDAIKALFTKLHTGNKSNTSAMGIAASPRYQCHPSPPECITAYARAAPNILPRAHQTYNVM